MTIDEARRKIITYFKHTRRLPSSYDDFCDVFGFSARSSAYELVQKLITAGVLEKGEKGKLLPKNLFVIPNLGIIKAGYPSPAETPGEYALDPYNFILSLPANPFVVTVSGDSMKDAFLNDGDIAVIDPDATPKVGDIVAALVDGEVTLKYFAKNTQGYYLHPANEAYPDIPLSHTALIQGVLKKVLRNY